MWALGWEQRRTRRHQISVCRAEKTRNKMKRQPEELEEISANKATDKRLISKIYKQLMQHNANRTNNPIKNGRPKQTFLQKRDVQKTQEKMLSIANY